MHYEIIDKLVSDAAAGASSRLQAAGSLGGVGIIVA